jgi:hypothetical protein
VLVATAANAACLNGLRGLAELLDADEAAKCSGGMYTFRGTSGEAAATPL